MDELNYDIDYKWLTEPTGDPFADTGGMVIAWLQTKFPNKDIMQLIEWATDVYVKRWGAKLHAFFLNSTITQGAYNTDRKILETLKYFKELLINAKPFKDGVCRISGRVAKTFYAGRDNHILSGSGGFVNFHHGFQDGLYLSKEILIRIFFVPLGVKQLSDKIAIIQANHSIVSAYYVENILKEHLSTIGSNISEGLAKSEFTMPSGALFDFVEKCVQDLKIVTYDESDDSSLKNVSLNLYHFTNFGASPTVDMYTLQSKVFAFYGYCVRKHHQQWGRFLRNHYTSSKFKDAKYNDVTDAWENAKESLTYDSYKVWRNPILERLLNGESILSYIAKWSKKNKFDFRIVEIYQINLRNMDQKALKKIQQIAAFIVSTPNADDIKKSITRLNAIKNSHEVRQYLLKLIAKNYNQGNTEPLIKLEEFVEYLFPDGSSWKEIRDLLLIAIYQKLHEIQLVIELSEEETELTNSNED